jgi:hypothetical protein
MMFSQNPRITFPMGVVLVGSMMFVACSDSSHGKAPSETHLITSANLSTGTLSLGGMSNITVLSGVPGGTDYFSSAIHEAEYCAPAATKPLRNDGVTIPLLSGPGGPKAALS